MFVGSVIRKKARLLTGSTYAVLGFEAARAPGGRVGQAEPTIAVLRRVLPLPDDAELIVRVNGGVQAAAGVMLALGKFPRLSAAVLIVSLIPTTIAGHAFWNGEDATTKKLQRVQFQKNLAMIGGLLFAVIDKPRKRRARPVARAQVSGRAAQAALAARKKRTTR